MIKFLLKNVTLIFKIIPFIFVITLIVNAEFRDIILQVVSNLIGLLLFREGSLKPVGEIVLLAVVCICLFIILKKIMKKPLLIINAYSLKPKESKDKGHMKLFEGIKTSKVHDYQKYNDIKTPGWLVANQRFISIGKLKVLTVLDYIDKNDIGSNKISRKVVKNNAFKLKLFELLTPLGIVSRQVAHLSNCNQIVSATTRGGKSVGILIPNIETNSRIKDYKNRPSMVISDPKGEIFNNTGRLLAERGYKVQVLNLSDTTMSDSFNPILMILDDFLEIYGSVLPKLDWDKISNTTNEDDLKTVILIQEIRRVVEAVAHKNDKKHIENDLNILLKVKLEKSGRLYKIKDKSCKQALDLKEEIRETNSDIETARGKLEPNTENIAKYIKISSNALVPTVPGDKAAFFTDTARRCIEGFMYFFLFKVVANAIMYKNGEEYSFESMSFKDKFNFTALGIEINFWMSDNERKKNNQIHTPLEALGYDFKDHFIVTSIGYSKINNDVKGNISTATAFFGDERVKKISASSSLDIADISKGNIPYAVFLITPDEDKTLGAFVSLFIEMLYESNIRHVRRLSQSYGIERLTREIRFVLEELANIPKISDLQGKLSICLGRGMSFQLILQDMSQLDKIYGVEEAQTIRNNCLNQTFLLSGLQKDIEEWSKSFGTKTKLVKDVSGSLTEEDSRNVSYRYEEVAAVTPSDLALTPMGRSYSKTLKQHPTKNILTPYFIYFKGENIQTTTPEKFFVQNNIYRKHNLLNIRDITF